MFHKKTLITLAALGLILGAGVLSTLAFSPQGEGNRVHKPQLTEEQIAEKKAQHQVVMDAIENNDYQAWLEAISDRPGAEKLTEIITEDNFDQFVAMHQLKQDGDHEGAKAIADELGLKPRRIFKKGMGKFFQHGGQFVDSNGDGVCDRLDLKE